ncbi:uncharacterized protein LOC111101337 [Crassostrea virginica]
MEFTLIVLLLQLAVVSSKSCLESVSTLSYVPSCPDNEEDLSKAVQKKQCKHLANVQSCTKPEDFRYHCIPNSWLNATVEVCVPVIFSQGYCIKFDEGGSQLQEMYDEDCTNFTRNKCPTRFISSDLMQYKQCNIIIKKQTTHWRESQENNPTNTMMILAIVFGVLLILLLVSLFTWQLYSRYRINDAEPAQNLEEEMPDQLLVCQEQSGIRQSPSLPLELSNETETLPLEPEEPVEEKERIYLSSIHREESSDEEMPLSLAQD